jgi:hypothetical protein
LTYWSLSEKNFSTRQENQQLEEFQEMKMLLQAGR